jgi:hypothetical protein
VSKITQFQSAQYAPQDEPHGPRPRRLQVSTGTAALRWFWALHPAREHAHFEPSGNAGRAKAEFEASWKAVESVGGNGGGWLTSRE